MDDNKLYLPDGLPLKPMAPEWLTTSWPMSGLESNIASVITIAVIFILLAIAAFFAAFVAKTFLPNWMKSISKVLLITVGAGCIAGAGYTGVAWKQDNSITDHAMGVQVQKTTDWLKTKGASADNRAVWNLVCFYYDDRNSNCDGSHATVYYKGGPNKVRLEKQTDGSIAIYDYENLVPLIE